ncbi:MAG: hypothetical protein ACXVBH_03665 [Flavisolibacter sp.]
MNSSSKRMSLLWLLTSMVLSNAASSQTVTMDSTSTASFSTFNSGEREGQNTIKWSWQLPQSIKKAFDKSTVCNWYIEKMISYDAKGRTLYSFFLDNSNLLDGDHYHCFFKKSRLTFAADGTIVDIATSKN